MQRTLRSSSSLRRQSIVHKSRRTLAKHIASRGFYNRRLLCEILEDRQLLSVGGPLASVSAASSVALGPNLASSATLNGAASGAQVLAADATGVNHAPVGTSNTVVMNENTPYVFSSADFGFTDPNDTPPNNLQAVEITTLPAAGSLTDNGVAVTAGQFVSVFDISGGLLTFTPAAGAHGSSYSSFTFQVQDDGGTAQGGVNLDPNAKTMTLNVTEVNQAPVGTSNTVAMMENTPYVFGAADFGFTDPNDTPPNNFQAVEITTLPTAGSLTDNGVAVTAGQFVSVSDISGGLLTFTPATGGFGSNYSSFTFQVQDDGGTAQGGVDLDPTAKTMTLNVASVTVGAAAPVLVAFYDPTAAAGTTFTASSTNPDVTATVLQTSELVKMTVHTVNSDDTSGPEGTMDFLLLDSYAPNNVQHVTSLINSGFYTGQDFFRIIQDFMIQGGDPTGTGTGSSATPGNPAQVQDDEFNADIRFTSSDLLAMANSGSDTNDCQFFITTNTFRDGDFTYTIIGKLVAGNNVLQTLASVPVQPNSSSGEDSQPLNPPIIDTVSIVPDTQYGLVMLKASGTATAGETTNVTVAGSDDSKATLTDIDGLTQRASLIVNVVTDTPSTNDHPAFLGPIPDVHTTMNTPVTIPVPVVEPDAGVPLYYNTDGGSDTTDLNVSLSGTGPTDGTATFTPSNNILGVYSAGIGVCRSTADTSQASSYDIQQVPIFISPLAPATLSVTTAGVQNGGTTSVSSNLAFHVTGLTNGLTVAIFVDGGATPIGTATAANGVADVKTTEQLSSGPHTFTVEQSFAYTSTTVGNRTIAAGTLYSTPSTSTVKITVDLTPTPNPITWAVAPYATSATSIEMIAATASAPGGVQYYFHCSAGGGNDSAWQASPIYEDIGLSPGTTYAYQVKTRSALSVTDVGAYSVSAVAMTPRVNEPPSVLVTTPLATPSGLIPISYTLSDPDSDVCSIQVQYSVDGGATWSTTATQGPGGSGTSGLTASPAGTVHTFAWSSYADLGKTDNANVEIQITPSDAQSGKPVDTGVFAVDNSGLTTALTLGPMSTAYLPGQSITISWLAGNVPANSKIGLEYYSSSNGSYTWIEDNQVSVADGAGSYVWNTSNMPAGTYCVEGEITTWVKPPIVPGTATPAMTSVTDVTSNPTPLFTVRPSATTFALTGSATGTFIAGQTIPIHWNAANVTAGSKISLCFDADTTWNDGNEQWIEIDKVAAANGYGTLNWKITGLAPGTYYVAGYLWNGVGAFTLSRLTQPITIVAAPQTFALTGPTSGTYQVGQSATITWTGQPAMAGSKISLCIDKDTTWNNGNETWIEIDHVSANGSGSYIWNTTGVAPGTYYIAGYEWNGNNAFTLSHLTKPITIVAPEALMVAAALPPQGSPALLTDAQLAPIVTEAEKRWEAELGTQATAALAGITIGVADLPAGMLGETVGSTIIIDQNAAGYGWFVDSTPGDDAEFTVAAGPYTLAAPQGTAAANRADLLTTVMHEMGHVLGYQDDDAGDLMNATLPLGARRTTVDAALATL